MNSRHSPNNDTQFLAIPPTPPQLKPTNSNLSIFSNLSTVSTRNKIRTLFSKKSVSSMNLQQQVSRQSNLTRNLSKPLSFLSTNNSSTSLNSNSSRFRSFFKRDKYDSTDDHHLTIPNRNINSPKLNSKSSMISINVNDNTAFQSNNSSNSSNKKASQIRSKSNSTTKDHDHHSHKLKRFFKKVVKGEFENIGSNGSSSQPNNKYSNKNNTASTNHNTNNKQNNTNNASPNTLGQIPVEISEKLTKKYGNIGKLLGSGAGGSVSIVTDPISKKMYAVKRFRPKLEKESASDYHSKVTGEYVIGASLNHQNIIDTIELIQDKLTYYVIMEYCEYDFFTIVMSGLMQKNEISCYFKQIINGVNYLHKKGLAHRDLKLDNCVVDNNGILKLIDFGSAVMFKYPDQDSKIQAKGIVGSDPYLAPEVLQTKYYDPTPVDIWSIAIIFCCMTLRRFPWKAPKLSDPSYKSFVSNPDEENLLVSPAKKPNSSISTVPVAAASATTALPEPSIDTSPTSRQKNEKINTSHTNSQISRNKLRGPYRLLRLLPHQSRTLIGDMLEIDPDKRISMNAILSSDFFNSINVCTCHIDGETTNTIVQKGDNHVHNLITEEHLEKLNIERERTKKLKNQGVV